MQGVDLVLVTGSQSNVRNAYSSGTPAIGVGAGNVVSIVDETASVSEAAGKIIISKTFDNATSCSSENSLVIVESAYTEMLDALTASGAVVVSPRDKIRLQDLMWQNGRLNPDIIAKSASHIAALAGLETPGALDAKVLLVEEANTGSNAPFSGEKLCPVLTLYRATDFNHAKQLAHAILNYQFHICVTGSRRCWWTEKQNVIIW